MTPTIAAIIMVLYWNTAPTAVCSWYGEGWNGNLTASGVVYDCDVISCAHKTLPLGTIIRFHNGTVWLDARVEDRGPYITGRDFDLSEAAADSLGDLDTGLYNLRYRIIGRDTQELRYNLDLPDEAACEREDLSRW